MTKKETFKWVVQIIASIATAILTAMGTTSCMGTNQKSVLELFQGALAICDKGLTRRQNRVAKHHIVDDFMAGIFAYLLKNHYLCHI